MRLRRKLIRATVEKLLAKAEVTAPPVPVERIARMEGMEVRRKSFGGKKVSGFLYRDVNQGIIGVNSDHHMNRQRFTIGHEIGHYLLHPEPTGEIHVDQGFQIKRRDEASSDGTDFEEIEANVFAAELLMPPHLVAKELEGVVALDIDQETLVSQLARRFRVSPQAMLFRLVNLGYLSL